MSDALPPCLACDEAYTYEQGTMLVCPMCGHEWSPADASEAAEPEARTVVRDAVGNELADGDDVTVVKDLKFKGGVVKVGTKVRDIRLLDDPVDGHDIDARVPGVGQVYLTTSVVKKG